MKRYGVEIAMAIKFSRSLFPALRFLRFLLFKIFSQSPEIINAIVFESLPLVVLLSDGSQVRGGIVGAGSRGRSTLVAGLVRDRLRTLEWLGTAR